MEALSRLKFIGKLKKGDKVNTHHMYVQPDGLLTSLSRTFMNVDARANTLSFVSDTIERAFDMVVVYENSGTVADRVNFEVLLRDLRQCMAGLKNLKVTYTQDTKFCCDIDTIIDSVNARLTRFSNNPVASETST